jgi:hypothetical protein
MAEVVVNKVPVQRGYKSQNYREITPDYIFGGLKTEYIEMTLVTTKQNAFEKMVNNNDVIEHTEEASIKMTPMQAKSIVIWMLQNVKLYETQFSKIPNIETDPIKIRRL